MLPLSRIEMGQQIVASGINYLSFSSMKELRNNEALFLKHYINYEWDNTIYLATIIGKSCHHGVEWFYGDPDNKELFEKDPEFVVAKVVKIAKDYAKNEYIAKYRKHEAFWTSTKMIEFWWYEDIHKLVDEYRAKMDEIKAITATDVDTMKTAKKEATKIETKIKKAIEKHKAKDEKLDDFINWWKTGTMEGIFEGIEYGISNWFSQVYPRVKGWKFIGAEFERTIPVADLSGEILEVPLKFIIDALFEDENSDLIIVDWKFKGKLSDDTSIKPDYDMQGTTYFFGCMTAFGKKPIKALFIEIQPSEAKPPYMQQAELRELCGLHGIDWETGNKGKYMTNALMTDALMAKGIISLNPVVYEYVINFVEKPYLLAMWEVFYHQTTKRLYELIVDGEDFMPNIFDASFDGGIAVYQDWMAQFKPEESPAYTADDVVAL